MKNIFIGWITFQLIAIGLAGVSTHNEMENNIYVCPPKTNTLPILMGAVFPLAYFVSSDYLDTEEYCLLQDLTNKDI